MGISNENINDALQPYPKWRYQFIEDFINEFVTHRACYIPDDEPEEESTAFNNWKAVDWEKLNDKQREELIGIIFRNIDPVEISKITQPELWQS